MERTFHPAQRIRGVLRPPGDKSISHRAVLLAAMAGGKSRVEGLAPGRDVEATIDCLTRLGVPAHVSEMSVVVEGNGWNLGGDAALDARNSGTTMRLLTGALAGVPLEFVIAGDESLSKRPMDRIAEPLRKMGAEVSLVADRYPPVGVRGGELRGVVYQLPVASAQVKGAILLAAIQAEGPTKVLESHPSRDHTERLLQWLGASISAGDGAVNVAHAARLEPFDLVVPGDFSSASFALIAALLAGDGDLLIEGVGLNPSRTGLLDVLSKMGAEIAVSIDNAEPEPAGVLRVPSASQLRAVSIDADLVVRTIDELPLVALAATQAEGTTVVRDASELRVKEADRIGALAQGLRALGADIEEAPGGFAVTGPTPLRGGRVDAAGDHRLAMTFAVAAMLADGPVTVVGWEWAGISYPDFENDLASLMA